MSYNCLSPRSLYCCISQISGAGRFSAPTTPKTPQMIFMKFEIYFNYLWDNTLHAKFHGGYISVGSLSKLPFCYVKVFILFRFFATPTGHT